MDSYEAGDQLGTLKAVKLWHYERFVDDVTGLIVSTESSTQTTPSGILFMIMT
jgi:hypothetical protein